MEEKFFDLFEEKLRDLREKNLYRKLEDIESKDKMKIIISGKEYINFASNDYLGLSQHPFVKESAIEAIKIFGVGSGASRLLGGGTIINRKLENLLSEIKGTEGSLLLNSGYTANTTLIPALANEDDIIFTDELNHGSIIDGCRLSRAKKIIYKHGDIEHLRQLINNCSCKGKRIIITDTVFSMDGDLAPLREIYYLCKEEGIILYIDDAHGTGVLGEGFGALKHFEIEPESFIIQMGTLSKAVGVFGAFVCGSSTLIDYFVNTARGLIFSTSLPPSIVASAYASLNLIMDNKNLVKRLWDNSKKIRNFIEEIGLKTTKSQTPIIPILFKNTEDAILASKILRDSGIYAPAIRPPTVRESRIRITVSAGHSDEDIERLKNALYNLK